jgi:hypothetical protein
MKMDDQSGPALKAGFAVFLRRMVDSGGINGFISIMKRHAVCKKYGNFL